MKQSIAFIRTSTDQQSVEDQQKELINYIIADGHTNEQIIIIGDKGASAIKEDEKYLQFIDQIKEQISHGEIDCVYAWEVSRIARHRSTFYVLIDFLKSQKVNLKIMKPSLSLFDKDGNIDGAADLAISVLVTMAEHEMVQKKERFARAKKGLIEKGLFCGGGVAYGYKVVEKKISVDNEKAKIVKEIYNMYVTKKMSIRKIEKELKERGINIPFSSLSQILRKKIYYGDNSDSTTIVYPPIISKDLWMQAQTNRQQNNCQLDKSTKHYFFGSKLIKCPHCGLSLVGREYKNKTYIYKSNCECENIYINAAMMDGLLWYHASILERNYIAHEQVKIAEEQKIAVEILKTKIENSKTVVKNLQKRIDRLNTMFLHENMTPSQYDTKTKEIKMEINQTKKQALSWEEEILKIQNPMEGIKKSMRKYFLTSDPKIKKEIFSGEGENIQFLIWVNSLVRNLDDEQRMQEICSRHIKKVEIEKVVVKKTTHYNISIITFQAKEYNYRYYPKKKDKLYKLDLMGNEMLMFETPYIYRVGDKLYNDDTYVMGLDRLVDLTVKNNQERKLRMLSNPEVMEQIDFDEKIAELK